MASVADFARSLNGRVKGRIARGAFGSLTLKIANYGLSFLLTIVLARILGATGFGAYALTIVWIQLLTTPATLGLNNLLIREIAAYASRSDWRLMRGLIASSTMILAGLATIIAVLVFAGTTIYYGDDASPIVLTFLAGLFLLPLFTLNQGCESMLKGLQHVVKAQVPTLVLRPILVLIIVGLMTLFWPAPIDSIAAVIATGTAAAITLALGAYWVLRYLPAQIATATSRYSLKEWVSGGMRLALVGAIATIHFSTDIVMLGALASAESAGIYRICTRLIEFVGVVGLAINAPFAPIASNLFASGQMLTLQQQITKVARLGFFFAVPIMAVMVVFGATILGLFGDEFKGGYHALILASIGRVAAMAFGPVMLLAMMLRFERQALMWLVCSTVANVVLNYFLIPRWDILGAAASTAITHTVLFAGLSVQMYRHVHVNTTSLGWPVRASVDATTAA